MRKDLLVFTLIGVLLILAVPLAAQDDGPAPVGLRPDAPTYALHGPYWVGTRDIVIDEESERPLQATIWYPALNAQNAEESVTYQPLIKWLPWSQGEYGVLGRALLNAEPDDSGAPYPLIIFSHGYSAFPASFAYLLEHLASYGFVVFAPDHSERWYFDADPWQDVPRVTIERPRDITRVLDYAATWTAAKGAFEGLVDMERVAASGQSIGGYTALAAAGARFDFEAYKASCADVVEDPALGGLLCDAILPYEAEMTQMAGLDGIPDGLWPAMGDTRVKAIIPMAGDAYLFGHNGLAEITIPMLALGGTRDDSTPYEWGARLAYDNVSSALKGLVSFEAANHFIFLTGCESNPWLLDAGFYFYCSDPVWDLDRSHDLINHFVTAFLLDVLKGDAEAHAALLPDAVNFPGITYETTMR